MTHNQVLRYQQYGIVSSMKRHPEHVECIEYSVVATNVWLPCECVVRDPSCNVCMKLILFNQLTGPK